jgi:hypothetical protein
MISLTKVLQAHTAREQKLLRKPGGEISPEEKFAEGTTVVSQKWKQGNLFSRHEIRKIIIATAHIAEGLADIGQLQSRVKK